MTFTVITGKYIHKEVKRIRTQRNSVDKAAELQRAQWKQKEQTDNHFISILDLNQNTCNSWDNTASRCASGLVTLPKTISIQTRCAAMLAMSLVHQISGSFWVSLSSLSFCNPTETTKQTFEISNLPPFWTWKKIKWDYYFNPEQKNVQFTEWKIDQKQESKTLNMSRSFQRNRIKCNNNASHQAM